jgi:hypothetical protein
MGSYLELYRRGLLEEMETSYGSYEPLWAMGYELLYRSVLAEDFQVSRHEGPS